MQHKNFKVELNGTGKRLDVYLTEKMENISRSNIQKLLENGKIMVNNSSVKSSYKVEEGDIIEVEIPPPVPIKIEPQDIPIDIVYENGDVIVVNKPKGMVVHPAQGNYTNTLVNALLFHCKDLSGINGFLRPGIVHRLDKDTSGLLIVAKNDHAHIHLAHQIKNRNIYRLYYALVHGVVKDDKGTIDLPVGRHEVDRKKMSVNRRRGREAISHYEVLERYKKGYSLVRVKLKTGRTHQIRVHLSYLGFPIVGDPVYGPKKKNEFGINEQLLHAQKLGFIHPTTQEYMEYSSSLPEYFNRILQRLV